MSVYKVFAKLFLCAGLIVFVVLVSHTSLFAINYYQRQSGNWNNPGTWTTSDIWNATVNTGTYPQAGDNVYFRNNGHTATITLTEDAECANLIFDNSAPVCVLALGNYDLIVHGNWSSVWGNDATLTQGSGYLQINGGVIDFNVAKTISNLRIGSSGFSKTGQGILTVTSNYDHNCYTSTIPSGVNANAAVKMNELPVHRLCRQHHCRVLATFVLDRQQDRIRLKFLVWL
jgi:hypothetical protein